jgi:hypothetical protein
LRHVLPFRAFAGGLLGSIGVGAVFPAAFFPFIFLTLSGGEYPSVFQ